VKCGARSNLGDASRAPVRVEGRACAPRGVVVSGRALSSARAAKVVVAAASLVFGLGAACSNGKQQAASLVMAIERYRRADDGQRPAESAALEQLPCTEADVCETKAACLAMSKPTVRAMLLKREVEVGLADLQAHRLSPDDPAAKKLPDELESASQMLAEGRAALAPCDAKLLELRRKYSL
jgi:hypothetical protein